MLAAKVPMIGASKFHRFTVGVFPSRSLAVGVGMFAPRVGASVSRFITGAWLPGTPWWAWSRLLAIGLNLVSAPSLCFVSRLRFESVPLHCSLEWFHATVGVCHLLRLEWVVSRLHGWGRSILLWGRFRTYRVGSALTVFWASVLISLPVLVSLGGPTVTGVGSFSLIIFRR